MPPPAELYRIAASEEVTRSPSLPANISVQLARLLIRKLKFYTEPTLLLMDELGYLSLDQRTMYQSFIHGSRETEERVLV